MANILPRYLHHNFSRILKLSHCRCTCQTKLNFYSVPNRIIESSKFISKQKLLSHENNGAALLCLRKFNEEKKEKEVVEGCDEIKLTLFQKFKKMYKEYWYVLIPVHVVTSVGWFGGFYYMARSGVDIISLLETLHVSEKIIDSLKDSHMGYVAIAYACYKIMTPARYTVTLGGTTITINYLKKWGYIKPVPSKEKLKEMYKEKMHSFDKSIREKKEDLKSKIDNRLEQGMHKIEELKDKSQKVKKKAENILKEKK